MKPLNRYNNMVRNYLHRTSGFTLVEFLVAALFLATVIALAAPRLWNMGSEARAAKQQAIFGSVRAAAQITRAAAQVHNQLGAVGSVNVDGTNISTIFGYPAATEAGIVAATGLDLANDQVSLSGGGALAGSTITVAINGARGTCTIVYSAPVSAETQPSINFVNSNGKGAGGC
jgi:MSHA pilin protein MshA